MQTPPIIWPHRLNSASFKKVEMYETIPWKISEVAKIYEIREIWPLKGLQKPNHISIKHQNKSVQLCKLFTVISLLHKNRKDGTAMVSHNFDQSTYWSNP